MTAAAGVGSRPIGDQHHPLSAETLDLGADLAPGDRHRTRSDAGKLVVGERVHAACSARSVSSSSSVGSSVVDRSSAKRTAQPVAADDLLAGDPWMQGDDHQLAGLGIGFHHGEVGDHPLRPAAAQPEPLAIALAVAVADRRAEVAALDERPSRLAHDHHHRTGRRSDLRCAAGAGQPGLRCVVRADHGGVDVGVLVELSATEEPDVDAAGLQPVGEDLRHADDCIAGLGKFAVADRQRQAGRLGPDAARFVDQHRFDGIEPPGQIGGSRGQPDADEALPLSCRSERARDGGRR